ncbi:B-cell receptor CD22 isoform X2 [Nasonia vitripennis]|uniref:Ig-like domain-containing protein n=1 Tax=Nasonia vitripennis TaxID=7425 RepID=A0A7M7QG95_NASVI|nr:B-cell receptor CD22 isoform X2 [Nasonia vitripennis]
MDKARGKICPVLALLLLVFGGATGLKSLKITVPERVRVGDSALLTCSYDLENVQLYVIKWYLDEAEFYRYVPKKDPPHAIFPVRGIRVNVSSSNTQDVTLVGVTRNHTGRYSCEVTEDGPTYDTKVQEAYVLVVDVPETEPRIVVDREHLPAGETLRANCTSGASHPAPNITWTLNGAPLNNMTMRFKVRTKTLPKAFDDRKSTFSTLNLETAGMFQDGRIRLRCFAEITPVYKASASKEITEEGPYLASITGDASPHSRHTSGSGRAESMSLWPCGLALNVVLGLLVGASSTR